MYFFIFQIYFLQNDILNSRFLYPILEILKGERVRVQIGMVQEEFAPISLSTVNIQLNLYHWLVIKLQKQEKNLVLQI